MLSLRCLVEESKLAFVMLSLDAFHILETLIASSLQSHSFSDHASFEAEKS